MVHMVNGTPTDQIIYSRNRQFRSGVNMKTGNYGCCCNDSVFSHRNVVFVQEQPKMPTAVKVSFWGQAFNFFANGIKTLVGLFSKKKAAPVQTPTATQSSQVKPEPQGVTTPTTATPTTVSPSTVKPEEVEETDNKDKKPEKKDNSKKAPSSVDMKDFSGNITVHDDELFAQLGEKADIIGKTTVSSEKGQGGYPVSMKVGNYNYALAKVDADGTVWYKSQNGSGQLYRLEKNADGTFGLNQHAGDEGVGEADVSKFKKSSASTSKKATTTAVQQHKKTDKSQKPSDSSSILSREDKEIKEHMSISQPSIKFADAKVVNGKPYFPQTVTCVIPPMSESKTVPVPADKVAEFNGDEAKIKDWALSQMRAEDKKSE